MKIVDFFEYQPQMGHSEVVSTLEQLKILRAKMLKVEEFAFDTETNTLRVLGENSNFCLVGISISWGKYNNYYIPVGHKREEDWDKQLLLDVVVAYLKEPFEREDVRVIGHNLKFDMHVMSRVGIHIRTRDLFDTMIASWLTDENSPNGLKENSQEKMGIDQTHFKDVIKDVPNEVKKQWGLKASSKATFDLTLIEESSPYALADSFYTWCLYKGFLDYLEYEDMDKIMFKVYVKFIRTLYDMEEIGVTVDVDKLQGMSEEIQKDMDTLEYEMYELAGVEFNANSSAQMGELLFGYVKPPKPVDPHKALTKELWQSYRMRDYDTLEEAGYVFDEDGNLCVKAKCNEHILKQSFKFKVLSQTASGAPQVNANTLWKLSKMSFKNKRKREGVELCEKLCEYKKLAKLRSAFIDGMFDKIYDDGKAHPSFNIIGTDSGRISCSEPNLQQLPKAGDDDKYQIRSLFIGCKYAINNNGDIIDVAEEVEGISQNDEDWDIKRKKIIALDFANLEMRILAHFSEDKNLLEMFASGSDTHGSTAVNMFELDCTPEECKKQYPHLRQAAKVINFLLMYGGGAFNLYNTLKDDHESPIDLGDEKYLEMYKCKEGTEVAQIYIDKYFTTYNGVAKFIKHQKRFAHKNGYVYTLLRRKRRLPGINSSNFKEVAYCERLSVNSAVQGSAADLTMSAQNLVNNDPWYLEHNINMILQVHDELVFECPEEYVEECIERTLKYMRHPFGENVELNLEMNADADFGDSYQDAK